MSRFTPEERRHDFAEHAARDPLVRNLKKLIEALQPRRKP